MKHLSRQKQVVCRCSCRVTAQQVLTHIIHPQIVNTHMHTHFLFLSPFLSLSPKIKTANQNAFMHSVCISLHMKKEKLKGIYELLGPKEIQTERQHWVTLQN